MPTQPDSIDIEQLRAQLEAIYAPAEEQDAAVVVDDSSVSTGNSYEQQDLSTVFQLTQEVKSHSPNPELTNKVERMALIGQHIKSLRDNTLRIRNG